jgi:propionyl-CoA synthetase
MDKSENNAYEVAYRRATNEDTREDFWREQAAFVEWFKPPTKILDSSNPPFYRWFADGALDRPGKELASEKAVIWVSNMVNK